MQHDELDDMRYEMEVALVELHVILVLTVDDLEYDGDEFITEEMLHITEVDEVELDDGTVIMIYEKLNDEHDVNE